MTHRKQEKYYISMPFKGLSWQVFPIWKRQIIMNILKKAQIVSEEFCNKAVAEPAVQRKIIIYNGRHRKVFVWKSSF